MKTVKGPGDRLSEVVAKCGRLCADIDPHPGLLDAWQLPHSADDLERFAATCVEAFGDIVTVAKLQVVFFEAYGSKGFTVLEQTLADLKDAGALLIADTKRGGIGSTIAAYTEAWLSDGSPLAADALAVFPYLGFGAPDPAVSLALENGHGLLVLAAMSNPEGASMQKATVSGKSLTQTMVNEAVVINACQIVADAGAGNIGVVIDATFDDTPVPSNLCDPILIPDVGAQGGTPADVDRPAGKFRGLTLSSVSRAILSARPDSAAL